MSRQLSHRPTNSQIAKVKVSMISDMDEDEEAEDLPNVGFRRILKMNKPEYPYMASK